MRVVKEGKVFEIDLVDDGTLDTVIAVNGKEYRFSGDAVEREEDGSITPIELLRLGNEAIEDMCEEEFKRARWNVEISGKTKTETLELTIPLETCIVFCSAVDRNGDELLEIDWQVDSPIEWTPPHEVECPDCGKRLQYHCIEGNHDVHTIP